MVALTQVRREDEDGWQGGRRGSLGVVRNSGGMAIAVIDRMDAAGISGVKEQVYDGFNCVGGVRRKRVWMSSER